MYSLAYANTHAITDVGANPYKVNRCQAFKTYQQFAATRCFYKVTYIAIFNIQIQSLSVACDLWITDRKISDWNYGINAVDGGG